jgi:6-pyruvoyltetrahydropterin/6-carboxytetrahydropterin synthase
MEITKRIEIDAGHRVPDHGSKCRSPHGHRYVVEMAVTGDVLAAPGDVQNGMVLDFGFMKQLLVQFAHDPWDHAFLLYERDQAMIDALLAGQAHDIGWKVDVLPCVPTAENLAQVLALKLLVPVQALTEGRCSLSRVTVWETPTCSASWERP